MGYPRKHGEVFTLDRFVYECIVDDSPIFQNRMTSTRPSVPIPLATGKFNIKIIGCITSDGLKAGFGSTWIHNTYVRKCIKAENMGGSIKSIACVTHYGKKAKFGAKWFSENRQWTCKKRNGDMAVVMIACAIDNVVIKPGKKRTIRGIIYSCKKKSSGLLTLSQSGNRQGRERRNSVSTKTSLAYLVQSFVGTELTNLSDIHRSRREKRSFNLEHDFSRGMSEILIVFYTVVVLKVHSVPHRGVTL